MADTLPSPPVSRASTPDSEAEHNKDTEPLSQRLDELLEQYLGLLDQYTTLREELLKSFSSGFFSLAQAQRTSTLGAGRRYGQECYDQRMKAQRVVEVTDGGNTEGRDIVYRVVKRTPPTVTRKDEKVEVGKAGTDLRIGSESEQISNGSTDSKDDSKPTESTRTEGKKQDPATRDPVTWFGLLAPPALRQCQSQFIGAVESQIRELVTVEGRMRSLEDDIWSLRDKLGILREYEGDKAGAVAEEAEESILEAKEQEKQPTKTSISKASRRSLPSRPAHSKSTLLKLGE